MKISVIVPCYNCAEYVSNCINSILNQTIGFENIELLLIDDASTDNTSDILKKYEERYPDNIGVILCEKNGRQGTARNIGLQYASGEYVSFVDSDDWIRSDMYERLLFIMRETTCDIVQFEFEGRTSYDDDNQPNFTKEHPEYKVYEFNTVDDRKNMLVRSDILNESCTRKLYRKTLLDKSNTFFAEGTSYEEPLFTYPLRYWVSKVAVTSEKYYFYRYNAFGTTVSYMNKPERILEHLAVQKQLFTEMTNSKFYCDYKDEIDLFFLHSFFVEPFYFMKARGQEMPVEIFKIMSDTVKNLLPDYLNNPYIFREAMKEEKAIIDLISL